VQHSGDLCSDCPQPVVTSQLSPVRCPQLGVPSLVSGRLRPRRAKALVGEGGVVATSLPGMGEAPHRPFPIGSPSHAAAVLLPWFHQRPGVLTFALSALALAVAGPVLVRTALARREGRIAFQLLPSRFFSPSVEDVRRFAIAAQARSGTLRRVLGACEPTVVRVRRRAPGDTAYVVEVPGRLGRRVRSACYPGTEPIETTRDRFAGDGHTCTRELVLARDSIHALRAVPMDHDPKSAICQVLDELAGEEEAEVVVVLCPAGPKWHRHLEARRRSQSPSNLLSAMWRELKENRPQVRPRRNVPDKAAGVPVFRVRLFVRVRADGARRARALASDLCWGFEVFSGENFTHPVGTVRRVLGPGAPLTARALERRLASGTIQPPRSQFVSLPEMAGLLHPPASHCRGAHVARDEAAPTPGSLPEYRLPVQEPR
jgi:hypothetical protein